MNAESEKAAVQRGQDRDGEIGGKWVTPAVSYVDPERRHCAYCGRPIARRYWEQGHGGERLAYCSPDHADRSATYPRGSDEPGA